MLDLYVCLRQVQWFTGVPSPVKHPEKVDMVIFRENTEDIYRRNRICWRFARSAKKFWTSSRKNFEKILRKFVLEQSKPQKEFLNVVAPQHPAMVDVGIGIKAVSYLGTIRLIHAAIQYAIATKRKSVTDCSQRATS